MANIKIETWGGGGAGGGSTGSTYGGGGGGGGAYSRKINYIITPAIYAVSIGTKGTGVNDSNGGDGENTTFDTNVVVAAGGKGGQAGQSGYGVVGGDGGATADCIGDVGGLGKGGNGGHSNVNSATENGGGGGESGWGVGDGNNGHDGPNTSDGKGGTGTDGYDGADGADRHLPGNDALSTNYGGGGGGSGHKNGSDTNPGGNGCAGQCVITWTTTDFGTCSVTGTGNTITTNGSDSIATFIVSGNMVFVAASNVNSGAFFNFF